MVKPTYATDESPRILEGNDLKALAKYMKSDSCQNIFLMVSVIAYVRFWCRRCYDVTSLGLVRLSL